MTETKDTHPSGTPNRAGRAVEPHWIESAIRGLCIALPPDTTLSADLPVRTAWEQARALARLSEPELADAVARRFRLPRADMRTFDGKALNLVPDRLLREFKVFPLREDYKLLVLATADPTHIEAEKAVSFASGRGIVLEIAGPEEIEEALMAHLSPDRAVTQLLDRIGGAEQADVHLIEDEAPEIDVPHQDVRTGPVVSLANVILREAVESGASDIHIQPTDKGGVIRCRIDGVLRNRGQMPMHVINRVVSRVKIMGKMDIADRLRPQDGRARVAIGGRTVDLRISTVPTRGGEKAVLRILDPDKSKSLEETGLLDEELVRFKHLLSYREGIVVVTGPTGSGKTTSLYAALRHIRSDDTNIMTVEDPVEYEISGVAQIQVEPKMGVTFASALRAILRQDPDIVLVGEIRDGETAQIAVQASLTGHMVLSTLHTNDAVGTLGRFFDLGIDRPTLADTLKGALAQRLVRRVCPECSVPVGDDLTDDEARLAQEYGVHPTVRAMGCEACGETGYRGRIPLVEVLTITPEIQNLMVQKKGSGAIVQAAKRTGFRTLREVGALRVRQGDTTLFELERIVGDVGGEEKGGAAEGLGEQRGPHGDDVPGNGSGATRVLLVDDDRTSRIMARALLEADGFFVEEATDGVECLDALRDHEPYHLVILDINMPRMKGDEALGRMRGDLATAGIPVIVLTGSEDPDAEFALMDAGADDYLRKPFDPRRFNTRVRAVLRRAEG